jgi:4-amino-4-deoxy-L-arabinose transferase-like glycosyltransferase
MATYVEPRVSGVPEAAVPAALTLPRWLPLAGILALQAIVALVTLRNTAFQDEALYLYAGRQIIHSWNGGPPPPENYAFYFSGYPNVYPVIGGFLDMTGGLELARAFSLACMLGVTSIGYGVTGKLFGRRAAIFAAAGYACAGVVLYVSRLAVFDAMCLLFIAIACGCAVYGGMNRRGWWLVLLVGPTLVIAVLAKYAALLFIPPAFALLATTSVPFLGWWRAIARMVLALVSFAASLVVAYRLMGKSAFHAINGSTTNRDVLVKEPRIDLLLHVLQMGGILIALALIGLLLALRTQWRYRMIALVFFGSIWLAPLYHIYVQEFISLDKHLAYALFFAMPLAGYALAGISGFERTRGIGSVRGDWVIGLAVVLATFSLGLSQSKTLYAGWANSGRLSTALHSLLRDGTGRILAEDIEVSRFDARDITEPWQWSGLWFLYYKDARGKVFHGNPAITQALHDRYYEWAELSFVYIPDGAYSAAQQMVQDRNYDLVAAVPFQNSYGKGHFYLFRLALNPGHGDFTSMAQLQKVSWGS